MPKKKETTPERNPNFTPVRTRSFAKIEARCAQAISVFPYRHPGRRVITLNGQRRVSAVQDLSSDCTPVQLFYRLTKRSEPTRQRRALHCHVGNTSK